MTFVKVSMVDTITPHSPQHTQKYVAKLLLSVLLLTLAAP
jgi:hypothetical protein